MRCSHVFILAVCTDFAACYILDYWWLGQLGYELSHNPLSFQWVAAGIRWVILYGMSNLSQGDSLVLRRWLTTHCVLGPVFWTGRTLLGNYPLDTSWIWFLNFFGAAFACAFWELLSPDKVASNGEENKSARILFKRVIGFHKPDYLLLFGAFIFLSLAVLCK